jgi:hypothetical protein
MRAQRPIRLGRFLYVIAFGLGLLVVFYWLTQIVRGHLLLHLRSVLDAKSSAAENCQQRGRGARLSAHGGGQTGAIARLPLAASWIVYVA